MSRHVEFVTSNLVVPAANDEERKWIESLGRLMARRPKRLVILECGDGMSVIDGAHAKRESVDLEDGKAERNGVVLAHVISGLMGVTGVSG